MQAGTQASKQAGRNSRQAGSQASRQAGRQAACRGAAACLPACTFVASSILATGGAGFQTSAYLAQAKHQWHKQDEPPAARRPAAALATTAAAAAAHAGCKGSCRQRGLHCQRATVQGYELWGRLFGRQQAVPQSGRCTAQPPVLSPIPLLLLCVLLLLLLFLLLFSCLRLLHAAAAAPRKGALKAGGHQQGRAAACICKHRHRQAEIVVMLRGGERGVGGGGLGVWGGGVGREGHG